MYERHGHAVKHSVSPEWYAWQHMKQRCQNRNNADYAKYGGRGIKVCQAWETFINFFQDMGERPSAKHSLERKDTNGDYTPENCKWATKWEQNCNRQSAYGKNLPVGVQKRGGSYRARLDNRTLYCGPSLEQAINARLLAIAIKEQQLCPTLNQSQE